MRIWDINPGYLNRTSLLGEHREIHGLLSVLINGKIGYSRHPETLRWVDKLPALKQRHDLLVAEMILRGYNHFSPFPDLLTETGQPLPHHKQYEYIDKPHRQIEILTEKYRTRESGRIPLPANTQELWAQHKYSIMARDPAYYKTIGPTLAKKHDHALFHQLSQEFVEKLNTPPAQGTLINALEHMWGYVSQFSPTPPPEKNIPLLMKMICSLSIQHHVIYLLHSTALSDLSIACQNY